MPLIRGEGMSQQPDGLLPTTTTGDDPQPAPPDTQDQRRPRASVKALRPLRGRPSGSSLDTDPRPTLPKSTDKAENAKQSAF